MHPRRSSSDRGQALSSFLVVVVVALLLVTGLVVDGGRKSAADRRAELTAAAAARAAVDATAAERQAGRRPDAAAAVAAANRVIADEPGMQGRATLAADGSVQVTTSTSIDTVFLSLIGIGTLQGHGSAQAQLFD
ncbi:pilus assembly protein TadE [Micropruina sp.]|uniref:pilus assembly protein TadE n=1 Tax=Micropruina sp. TaxID=2737536 RepID=UPI0039E708E1